MSTLIHNHVHISLLLNFYGYMCVCKRTIVSLFGIVLIPYSPLFSSEIILKQLFPSGSVNIREVKFDVYGKRQTANCKLLPSVFSSLYSRIKIFVFAMNSKRHFSIFV